MTMTTRTAPYTQDQVGRGTARFPSGAPMPSPTDISVDPYAKTRVPKAVQVEGLMYWPQDKGPFPGLLLLHEAWGLNVQIQAVAVRLAAEGFVVLVPNLYGRQGGMVTANAEIAQALAERINEADLLQDLNSACEFLNTRDQVKGNLHGAVGFGLGGSLAIRLACRRKRLRAAVSFYGQPPAPLASLQHLACPLLYHRPGADETVSAESIEALQAAAQEHGKRLDVALYEQAPHAFFNDQRQDTYRKTDAAAAWDRTVQFLNECLKQNP